MFALIPESKFLRSFFVNRKYSLSGVVQLYPSQNPGEISLEPPAEEARIFTITPDSLPVKFASRGYNTLYFRGHFDYDIPKYTSVLLRLDDISIKFLVNGTEVFSYNQDSRVIDYTRSPFFGYKNFSSYGISKSDVIEVYLSNYYTHNADKSFNSFFENIYRSSPYYVSSTVSRISLLDTVLCFSLVFIGIFVLLIYFVLRSKGQNSSYLLFLGIFTVTTGLKLVSQHNIIMLLAPFPVTLEVVNISFKYLSAISFAQYLNSLPDIKKSRALDLLSGLLNFIFIFAFLFIFILPGHAYLSFFFFFIEEILILIFFVFCILHSIAKNRGNFTRSNIVLYISSSIYILMYGLEITKTGSFFKPHLPFELLGFLLFILGHVYLFRCYIQSSVEARAKSRHLEDLAYRDPLTHTGNRQGWLEKTKRMNEKFITGDIFGVAMFDLNNLKIVNDQHGHGKGDEYIKMAAEIICKIFKNSPVYRIGGDEFVAILNSADCIDTNSLRERLEMDCYAYYCSHRENKNFSIASGYAIVDYKTDSDFQDVFKRADENMYAHKKIMKERDRYERS